MRQIKEVARSTPFDNSTNWFDSTNVQDAIEEASLGHKGLQQAVVYVVGSQRIFVCYDDLVDQSGNPLSRVVA